MTEPHVINDERPVDSARIIREQARLAREVLASMDIAISNRQSEGIVLSAYKAGNVNDLNGRASGGVGPEAWSVTRLIAGIEKHAGVDRTEARDAADALTDAIVPERWTIRRLRRMVDAAPPLGAMTMVDLHRHSDGRASGLPGKMAGLGAHTVADVARLGQTLPPNWIERTINRLKAMDTGTPLTDDR